MPQVRDAGHGIKLRITGELCHDEYLRVRLHDTRACVRACLCVCLARAACKPSAWAAPLPLARGDLGLSCCGPLLCQVSGQLTKSEKLVSLAAEFREQRLGGKAWTAAECAVLPTSSTQPQANGVLLRPIRVKEASADGGCACVCACACVGRQLPGGARAAVP